MYRSAVTDEYNSLYRPKPTTMLKTCWYGWSHNSLVYPPWAAAKSTTTPTLPEVVPYISQSSLPLSWVTYQLYSTLRRPTRPPTLSWKFRIADRGSQRPSRPPNHLLFPRLSCLQQHQPLNSGALIRYVRLQRKVGSIRGNFTGENCHGKKNEMSFKTCTRYYYNLVFIISCHESERSHFQIGWTTIATVSYIGCLVFRARFELSFSHATSFVSTISPLFLVDRPFPKWCTGDASRGRAIFLCLPCRNSEPQGYTISESIDQEPSRIAPQPIEHISHLKPNKHLEGLGLRDFF